VSPDVVARVSFRMPGTPYTNWVVLLAMGFVAVMLAIHGSSLMTLYIAVAWFGLLVIAYHATAARHAATPHGS